LQTDIRNQHKTKRVSRRGQGAGAWRRTCCYWFCGSDGELNVLDGSIVKNGFWAIIERKYERSRKCAFDLANKGVQGIKQNVLALAYVNLVDLIVVRGKAVA
jgi:hypothetical protein